MKRAKLRRKWSATTSKPADNLSKAGWSWGCVAAIDSNGQTIFVADAHRDDGKRYVVHAEERLTAFVELEAASDIPRTSAGTGNASQRRTARRMKQSASDGITGAGSYRDNDSASK